MHKFLHLQFANQLRKYAVFTLACSWIIGLFLGISVAKSVAIEHPPLTAAFQNHSFISGLIVILFPYIVTISLMYIGLPQLIPAIALLKSFSFAYVSWILMKDFGSAGWLIQFLMMFSDCVSLPLLWWLWCRFLKSRQASPISLSAPIVIAVILVTIFDHRIISSILSSLQIS